MFFVNNNQEFIANKYGSMPMCINYSMCVVFPAYSRQASLTPVVQVLNMLLEQMFTFCFVSVDSYIQTHNVFICSNSAGVSSSECEFTCFVTVYSNYGYCTGKCLKRLEKCSVQGSHICSEKLPLCNRALQMGRTCNGASLVGTVKKTRPF